MSEVLHSHKRNGIICTDPKCWCHEFLGVEDYFNEDIINNPKHYQLDNLGLEALDIIKETLNIEEYRGYLIGNMLKYILRHKKKNNVEDLKKMLFYSKELDKCM